MKICPTRPTLCIFPAPYCEPALRGPPGPRAAMGHRLPVLVQHCPCAAGMAASGAGSGPAAVVCLALAFRLAAAILSVFPKLSRVLCRAVAIPVRIIPWLFILRVKSPL